MTQSEPHGRSRLQPPTVIARLSRCPLAALGGYARFIDLSHNHIDHLHQDEYGPMLGRLHSLRSRMTPTPPPLTGDWIVDFTGKNAVEARSPIDAEPSSRVSITTATGWIASAYARVNPHKKRLQHTVHRGWRRESTTGLDAVASRLAVRWPVCTLVVMSYISWRSVHPRLCGDIRFVRTTLKPRYST